MPYNTNNPVPSSDLRDVYDNSQTMDEVVNSSSKEVTTRTGKKVKTLAGLQSDVVGIGQSANASAQAAANSATAAAQSAADAANSAAATGYVDAPFPDVWAPLSDDLRLLAGFAPADTITVGGTSYSLPTKSMTFTRSTTGTYIDKSGLLRTAAINEPRFEKEGLLIEAQSANTFINSEDPTKWSGFDTRQTLAVINDGDTKAVTAKITTTATSSQTFYVYNANGITLSAGEYCTLSVRIKGTFGRCELRMRLDGNAVASVFMDFSSGAVVTPPSAPELTATTRQGLDGYSYITATLKVLTDGIYSGSIVVAAPAGGAIAPVGTDFYLQTAQFEKSPQATSYIPTAGASVTRAADDPTLQRSGNGNYWGPITISLELHCNGLTASDGISNNRRGVIAFYPSSTEYVDMMIDSSTTQSGKLAFAYGARSYNFYSGRIDDGKVHRVVSVTDTQNNKSVIDGGNPSTPTAASRPAPGTTSSVNSLIYFGRAAAGTTAPGQTMLNGHIRNLRIWHRALSDIQIKGLS